jgi:hypothetical protein
MAPFGDFFHDIETYKGGWDWYREKFLRHSEDQRIIELTAYDKLLEGETAPSRQTAEYIQKRRELGDLHELLKRGGR